MSIHQYWVACDNVSVISPDQQRNSHFSVLKSCSGEFLGLSTNVARIVGYANPIDMLGTTDFELRCPTAVLAERFIARDQKVWREHLSQYLSVQISSFSQGVPQILMTERILHTTGVLSHCWFIQQCVLSRYLQFVLAKLDRQYYPQLHRDYTIITSYDGLSVRESEVLFFLMEGLTAREISLLLIRSKRTIEHHIERIKEKMRCYTKDQLASLGRFLQYHQSIPKRLVISGTIYDMD